MKNYATLCIRKGRALQRGSAEESEEPGLRYQPGCGITRVGFNQGASCRLRQATRWVKGRSHVDMGGGKHNQRERPSERRKTRTFYGNLQIILKNAQPSYSDPGRLVLPGGGRGGQQSALAVMGGSLLCGCGFMGVNAQNLANCPLSTCAVNCRSRALPDSS